MRTFLSILIAAFFASGCGLMKAPSVSVPKGGMASASMLGLEEMCDGAVSDDCGSIRIDLKPADQDERWIYWKAGSKEVLRSMNLEFAAGLEWDMRITTKIPFVATNGGDTLDETFARELGSKANAAIAAYSQREIPREVSQVLDLNFVQDKHEWLSYHGQKFLLMNQNPVVNTIGSGMLSDYDMGDHKTTMSRRIFILRAADGRNYYAIRFLDFDRAAMNLIFEWRKLL